MLRVGLTLRLLVGDPGPWYSQSERVQVRDTAAISLSNHFEGRRWSASGTVLVCRRSPIGPEVGRDDSVHSAVGTGSSDES